VVVVVVVVVAVAVVEAKRGMCGMLVVVVAIGC
jgi:hypothetical protein